MTLQSRTPELLRGFENAAFESNAVFRTILDAMAHPGRIYDLPLDLPAPAGLNKSATAFLLAMADMDTTIWLSPDCASNAANAHLKFHCGSPITGTPSAADFAVANLDGDLAFITDLALGNAEYPDQSATLILQVEDISNKADMTLRGPGIKENQNLSVPGLPAAFHAWRSENHHLFPCGVDVVFAADRKIAALPRTTRIEVR